MKLKKNHIVFTTIFIPRLLNDIYKNLIIHNHIEDTVIWVVGDKKTPIETKILCDEIKNKGLEVNYLNIEDQDEWGENYPQFYKIIPYNNETRRNIGYLKALEYGCERLISIDDDNWPTDDDFIGGHNKSGSFWDGDIITEKHGYHNVCEYINFDSDRLIYPRGFPFELRGTKNSPTYLKAKSKIKIGVVAGLWLREPDIDATTWINGKINGINYNGPDSFVLDHNTWSPINTQNTSVVRDLIPAYFCIPMGWDVPGGKIQRYGDIWGGYFLQALIRDLKYYVSFGRPLVDHRRNAHNYVDDLRHEFWGMILTDWLLELLRNDFKPRDNDICDRIDHLSEFLFTDAFEKLPKWCAPEMGEFIKITSSNLSKWNGICRKLR